MSPTIREQTRKYKEMFEAMYLKQKANNSFFTGDTHVLDLTSRGVVARSLENAAQQQQQQDQQQRQEQLDQIQDQLDQQQVRDAPSTSVEVSLVEQHQIMLNRCFINLCCSIIPSVLYFSDHL